MGNNTDWSECKGCEVLVPLPHSDTYVCGGDSLPIFFDMKCPCLHCLVKMRCSKACGDFDNYISMISCSVARFE